MTTEEGWTPSCPPSLYTQLPDSTLHRVAGRQKRQSPPWMSHPVWLLEAQGSLAPLLVPRHTPAEFIAQAAGEAAASSVPVHVLRSRAWAITCRNFPFCWSNWAMVRFPGGSSDHLLVLHQAAHTLLHQGDTLEEEEDEVTVEGSRKFGFPFPEEAQAN